MSFPTELVSMSLQYLNKADLKNARLVSKQWSGCASEYLFAKIFISPHRLNLNVFIAISRDPNLSMCVTELEFDSVKFMPDICLSEYFAILWCQTETITFMKEHVLNHPDPEINHFLNLLNDYQQNTDRSHRILAKAQSECSGFTFIRKGYSKWMEEARYETECTERKYLLKVLIPGLQNLSRLRSVKLRGGWYSRDMLGRRGSPLARTWNPLHAHPGHWNTGSMRPSSTFKVFVDFHNLTFALSAAGVAGVRELSIESIYPPPYFPSADRRERAGFVTGVASVYARLENLKLSLPGWCDNPMVGCFCDLHGLSRMLGSMTALKRFELELPHDHVNDPVVYFPYSMVFPQNGHWPQITAITVRNLAISTKDLITLLITQMPSLRHLAFGNISLLDGHWEGIVEYLRISNRLSSFHIGSESFLLHRENEMYLALGSPGPLAEYHSRIGRSYNENIQSLMNYVVSRQDNRPLKHPSLMPDQPAQHSANYLTEVFRLCGWSTG